MIGQAFIISAPAGTGKTTLVKKLTSEVDHIVKSITYTTRKKREIEVNHKDYHFVSYQEFEKMIKEDKFIEYAQVFDHFYGTSKKELEALLKTGQDVVLVIDTQGALALKKFLQGVYIFISPPSIDELKNRLDKRKSECEKSIELRLSWAQEEMDKAKLYDYQVINEDLDQAYDVLKSIFIAQRNKVNKK